jgi:uncharacterized membrane protein YfhO
LFSSDYQVVDRKEALQLIGTVPVPTVILERNPGFASAPNRADDPQPEVISTRLNSLDLRVRAPRPGLLYLAESYYDGWSATVNGEPTNILPANYGFRAIPIPAGDVRVRLSYLPVGFILGACISLFGVGCVIALAMRKPATLS